MKKADIRQCRLCLRILPRTEVRETCGHNSVDLSRKIETAVSVRILKSDKLTTVCVNCLQLVDISYNFRMACMKTNIIYAAKLVTLHEGTWLAEDKQELLDGCQELVRRHRMEMDKLFNCSGYESESLEYANSVQEEPILEAKEDLEYVTSVQEEPILEAKEDLEYVTTVLEVKEDFEYVTSVQEKPILEVKEDLVAAPMSDEIDDSDREAIDEWVKMISTPVQSNWVMMDNGSIPMHRYICEICGQVVEKNNEEYHRNEHLNITPYKCPNCPMAYHSAQALQRHKLKQHGKIFIGECPICHKKIRGKGMFNGHVARHSDPTRGTAPCDICGKRYRRHYLQDHMNTHTGNMSHECNICGRQFAAKTNLYAHMKKHHANAAKAESTDLS